MMHEAVKRIVEAFRLTPREVDVVIALVDGHVTARDLARHLKLAESTVQNHIDNISTKSGLAGKSELLVHVIQKAFQLLENARFFIVTPSVLVLDDHADLADGISTAFRDKGCRASAAYEVRESLIDRIVNERIDLVICDVRLGQHDGVAFLQRLRSRVLDLPSMVVISADPMPTGPDVGFVSAWLKKPLDLTELFERSVDALIGRERSTGRAERMSLDAKVMVNGRSEVRTYEIGAGGMAITSGDIETFDAGRRVQFELELPEKTVIRGEGETVWAHDGKTAQNNGRMAGIRFHKIEEESRSYLTDYVRTKNILKFIPLNRVLAPKRRIG